MSFSPIPIFKNVDMEVDVVRCGNTPSSSDLATTTRLEVPTFTLSGITYEKSNSSQSYNDIVVLPSGYSYYVLAGCHGGATSDYNWSARIQLYDEDAGADTGSRAYYSNKDASNDGGSASLMQWFGRLSSCVFLPNLSSSKRLSLRVNFSNGPFQAYNYNQWTIYRIAS